MFPRTCIYARADTPLGSTSSRKTLGRFSNNATPSGLFGACPKARHFEYLAEDGRNDAVSLSSGERNAARRHRVAWPPVLARIRTGSGCRTERGDTRQRHASSVYQPQTASDRLTSLSRLDRSGGRHRRSRPSPLPFPSPPCRLVPLVATPFSFVVCLVQPPAAIALSLFLALVKSPRLVPSAFVRLRLYGASSHFRPRVFSLWLHVRICGET